MKKWLSKIFIDGSAGYANGVFITLVLGTVLTQVTNFYDGSISKYLAMIASFMIALTGAAIGAGISIKWQESAIVTLSATISGLIGAHASEIVAGTMVTDGGISLNGAGEPLGAFIAATITVFVGNLISKRAPMKMVTIPCISILAGGIAGIFLANPIHSIMVYYAKPIIWAMEKPSFVMGGVVAFFMGLAYVLPISTALIGDLSNISGLAAGAAMAGICCQTIGFAVLSYKDNKISGVLAQGIGSPVLQLSNIVKKPFVIFPTLISSIFVGMISAGVLHMQCTMDGIDIGGTAFYGQMEAYHATTSVWGDDLLALTAVILVYIILPGVLTHLIGKYFYKEGIIKPGNLKIG